MKQLFFFFLLAFSQFTYADGMDEIRIYVNQKMVATVYEGAFQNLELEISPGDTLKFEAWTDWGGMEQSSISVFDYLDNEKTGELARIPSRKYEAGFQQIITPGMMDNELLFIFNFSPEVNRTWKFARIMLKAKTE